MEGLVFIPSVSEANHVSEMLSDEVVHVKSLCIALADLKYLC